LLLTEPPATLPAARRRIASLLFDRFHMPAICIVKTAELATLASGRPTALVLDLGGGSSTAAAVDRLALVLRGPPRPSPVAGHMHMCLSIHLIYLSSIYLSS